MNDVFKLLVLQAQVRNSTYAPTTGLLDIIRHGAGSSD
jgi:hypothetical protein